MNRRGFLKSRVGEVIELDVSEHIVKQREEMRRVRESMEQRLRERLDRMGQFFREFRW